MKTRQWMILAVAVLAVATAVGFQVHAGTKPQSAQKAQVKMKILAVKWQRLVGDTGQTCDRCGSTQDEVRKAHALLRKSLAPLGINVILEEKALTKAEAAKNIEESNRIWIAGKPLETWLGATSGTSECSSCGPLVGASTACRTVVVGRNNYESIPAALIIKAGLLAAADIVGPETAQPRNGATPFSGVQTITDGTSGSGDCCGQ